MYNGDLKKRFIEEREASAKLADGYLRRIFTETEAFEEVFGKDVSEFTTTEILDYYKVKNSRSLEVLENLNSQLSAYTQWCFQQNLIADGINHFNEINSEAMNSCVNKAALQETILDRDQLLEIVGQLKNPRDRFVLMMLFETGREKNFTNIFNTKISDFNLEENKVQLGDRCVDVSRELINTAFLAADTDIYYTFSLNPKNIHHTQRNLAESEFIYRETIQATNMEIKIRVHRLSSSIRASLDAIGVKKSWTKLNSFSESGLIYHIKQLSKEKGIDPETLIKNQEYREMLMQQHAINKIIPASFLRKYGEYL